MEFFIRGGRMLVMVAMVCLLLAPRAMAADAQDDYNLAVNLYKQSRWKQAAVAFRSYQKLHPNHERIPLSQLYLGLTLVNLQDYEAARGTLRQFSQKYPDNPNQSQARFRIAESSYLLDDYPAATTELQSFLQDYPNNAFAERAYQYLGDTQLRAKDPQGALATFGTAIERFPSGPLLPDLEYGRAKALDLTGRSDEAAAAFEKLIADRQNPRADDAQYAIAARLFDQSRFAEAAIAYGQVETNFPDSSLVPSALLNAGYALYRQDKFTEAAAAFDRAGQAPRQAAVAAYWKGLSLKQSGEPVAAIAAFQQAEKLKPDDTQLQTLSFQIAVCQRQAGQWDAARKQFLDVAERWPQGEFGDDALYSAADAALELGELKQAAELLDRLLTKYPNTSLRMYSELLAGRLGLARVTADPPLLTAEEKTRQLDVAAQKFEWVRKESTLPKMLVQANYDLALTRELQGRPADAIAILTPLIEQLRPQMPQPVELGEALIVQAQAFLVTEQFDKSLAIAREYSQLFPDGSQLPRSLSIAAIAAARSNQPDVANTLFATLKEAAGSQRLVPSTLFQLAEAADGRKDWPAARQMYQDLIPLSAGADNQAFAYRGLGWAYYEQQHFADAAQAFGQLVERFPTHRLVQEAGYYQAEALRQSDQTAAALVAYQSAIDRGKPTTLPEPEAEQNPPLLFVYRSALQRARTLRTQGKVDESDAAYDLLLQLFPKPLMLDRILNEWAILNYEAGRYDRADRLFERLLSETPDSDLADNARLSLAESDLVENRLDEAAALFQQLADDPKADSDVRERSVYQLLVIAIESRQWNRATALSTQLGQGWPESQYRPFATLATAEVLVANPQATPADWQQVQSLTTDLIASTDPARAEWKWLPRVWILAAESALRLQDYSRVETLAAELKKLEPRGREHYQIAEIQGRALKNQARFDEARAVLEEVLTDPAAAKTETAAKAQFLIADTYLLQEKWEEAFLAYQRVYTSSAFPQWQSAALYGSAQCDEQLGQWMEAVADYRKLIDEFPESEFAAKAGERIEAARQKAADASKSVPAKN